MTLSVVGSILVTDRLGPLETQIEPKPACTSRGVDCRISAATLPTGAGPETLVEDWPQAVTDMTARMVRMVFNRQATPEHYSASSLAPRCEPLLQIKGWGAVDANHVPPRLRGMSAVPNPRPISGATSVSCCIRFLVAAGI